MQPRGRNFGAILAGPAASLRGRRLRLGRLGRRSLLRGWRLLALSRRRSLLAFRRRDLLAFRRWRLLAFRRWGLLVRFVFLRAADNRGAVRVTSAPIAVNELGATGAALFATVNASSCSMALGMACRELSRLDERKGQHGQKSECRDDLISADHCSTG